MKPSRWSAIHAGRGALDTPFSRRLFLGRAGALAGAVVLGGLFPALIRAAGPQVVVVGAGLAGLTAAYRLARAGLAVTVLEASDRLGGRTLTVRGSFPNGRHVEAGGEGVGSRERAIRRLCSELGLRLVDTWARWPDGRIRYRYASAFRSRAALERDIARAAGQAEDHYAQLDWPIDLGSPSARARYWDSVSVSEWIDRYCPGGLSGAPGRYLRTTFEDDFGGPVDTASAVTVIEDLGGNGGYGSDERWAISAGSDALALRLAAALPAGALRQERELIALTRLVDGRLRADVRGPAGIEAYEGDHMILALPFAALARVDLSNAGLPEWKLRAIHELGMGGNTKLHLAFSSAPWEPRYSGETWTDGALGTTWPGAVTQGGPGRIVVSLNGPSAPQYDTQVAHGPLPHGAVDQALADLEIQLPGSRNVAVRESARVDKWSLDPFSGGSYAYYRTGGHTQIAGLERIAVGRLHFAGEHTAPYAQRGTMNGAVLSGERAAAELTASIPTRHRRPPDLTPAIRQWLGESGFEEVNRTAL